MLDYFRGTVTAKDFAVVGAVVGLTALVVVAFYFLVYAGQERELGARTAELEEIRADLRDARKIKEDIDDLARRSEKMEQLVAIFQDRLPEESEIPKLMLGFEQMGDSLGLSPQLEPLDKTEDSRKLTIRYKVTASGSFHDIMTFVNQLERDDRYLKISDLDIGPEELFVSKATFTLSTYRFIQTKASAQS